MKHRLFLRIVLLLSLFAFLSCTERASKPVQEDTRVKKTHHTFDFDECLTVDTAGMVKKVDNFAIIFDPSASMTKTYEASNDCISCHDNYKDKNFAENHAVKYGGRNFAKKGGDDDNDNCAECHQNYLYSRFDFAKQLTKCFNKSIPDLELISILRTFGYPVYSRLGNGPEKYDKESLDRSIRKMFDADGASPLDLTLNAVGKDLFKKPGKKAVIVISDGEDMGEKEILASQDLKARYGDNICIYTIQIGNDPSGEKIMDRIAVSGECGLSIKGEELIARAKMEDLIREIFLKKGSDANTDEDADGIPDLKDDCPGTLPGLEVDEKGCWKLIVSGNVLFDFDKYNLKPEGVLVMNQIVALLNKHNFLDLQISGHTDNYGSMNYNINLSKQRMQTGFDFLQKNGINPDRVSTSWHSYTIPVATNSTDEGRALNRRLEFNFTKRTTN